MSIKDRLLDAGHMSDYADLVNRIHQEILDELDQGMTFGLSMMSRIAREHPPEYIILMPDRMTLFGMPVRIDNTIPANEIRLIDGNGTIHRIVNIGTGDE